MTAITLMIAIITIIIMIKIIIITVIIVIIVIIIMINIIIMTVIIVVVIIISYRNCYCCDCHRNCYLLRLLSSSPKIPLDRRPAKRALGGCVASARASGWN